MKKIYILCATLLGLGIDATAQNIAPIDTTLNRTVVVEKEYNPIIQGASKVNVLPQVEDPTISQKEVEYALGSVSAKAVPVALIKPFVAKEYEGKTLPGYLRLGYGNYGNLDARAHYTFSITPKDQLSFDITSYGMNGKLKSPFEGEPKWKARYYKTVGGIDYKHQFDLVDLNVFGGMGVHNFNYMDQLTPLGGALGDELFENFNAPKQRFSMGNFGVGAKSTDEFARILYDVTAQFMFYSRQNDIVDNQELKESLVKTDAKFWTVLDEENKLGLNIDMYNRIVNSDSIKNSTTLDLNPYYALDLDSWKIRLGAHLDLGFGFGESFLVSPDVQVQYIFSDSYVLYANAKGGRINTTFRRYETLSPYTFILKKNRDTYEQLNASLGFKASPIPGLWINIYGGFQKLKDDLYQNVVVPTNTLTYFANEDTKNFYGGATIQYDYKNIVQLNLAASGYKWKTDGYNNNALLFKPKMDVEAGILVKPIKPLQIGLNYKLVTREQPELWTNYFEVENISNLSANMRYTVLKQLSVYATVDNILNKKFQYYYGYPIEGINFMAGLSFQF